MQNWKEPGFVWGAKGRGIPPHPSSLQPYLPSQNPVPHSLRSIVKTQPPLFPWPGLLKQRALHEKKRLVFKCCAVKGGLFQVRVEICSDSRVPLLFFQDEALLEPESVSIHYWKEHTKGVYLGYPPHTPLLFQLAPSPRQTETKAAERVKRYSSKTCLESKENVWACSSFRY